MTNETPFQPMAKLWDTRDGWWLCGTRTGKIFQVSTELLEHTEYREQLLDETILVHRVPRPKTTIGEYHIPQPPETIQGFPWRVEDRMVPDLSALSAPVKRWVVGDWVVRACWFETIPLWLCIGNPKRLWIPEDEKGD